MQIHPDILISYGGFSRRYLEGAFVFHQYDMPVFYYQIISGEVKVFSSKTNGSDLIQGIFQAGNSFGEPPLLLNKPYPSSAQVTKNAIILKITREGFLSILEDHPDIAASFLQIFAERIYNKAMAVQVISTRDPRQKIIAFLDKTKQELAGVDNLPILIPYTRQQIADFTGLRVETVIRTLKKMSEDKNVEIINHKLYY